ncbi:MAG: aminotransferase class III-fold pyridoxal phosphate-dependent enzyme [Candidatus Rokubacteria bacterium]|nr:aminotransferase class III-fold pyridoxal phosphate-dependent enzyme [Candidatus Rokubacteria bacterium]
MTDPEKPPATEAERLYRLAQHYLAGGVSAAARVHPSLGRPFMTARGEGARLHDVDGKAYIDLHTSSGASLLGHGHPAVRRAVQQALELGIVCAHETPYQAEVARKLTGIIPCAELVRFTGSGTETTWHAIRTARAYTGRSKVVKFEGHFHGYHDYLGYSAWPPLDAAGPEEAPTPYAESGGIPPELRQLVIVLPWNNAEVLERTLRRHGDEIAAVIMEPINYNSGTILPVPGYLEAARRLTREHGIVLIFDEILSGFRTGPSCAQGYLGVTPDLCTLGKALGGGTVLSAFAGRREVMDAVAPRGAAVHSGTFNAHLIPILAANAFLDEIAKPEFWAHLERLDAALYAGLGEAFKRAGLPVRVQAVGARFSLLFGLEEEPRSYRQAAARFDRELARRFFAAALEEGVYFHYGWHHGISAMHTAADIDEALEAIAAAARRVARG